MKRSFAFIALLCASLSIISASGRKDAATKAPVIGERWSEERANEWYAGKEWPVGCVFIPSYAGTPVEMWGAEYFQPEIVDHELGLAESLGFNTIRLFLCDIVWQNDPDGFMDRLEKTISLADKHGLSILMTFFTNGGTIKNPYLGPQPQPAPGIHNSTWMSSPGRDVVNNPEKWPVIEKYLKTVMNKYKDDDRILAWCLYNEPENTKTFNTLPFLREVFKWAREVNPSQPLTAPMWCRPGTNNTNLPIVAFVCENSDIISFHCYSNYTETALFVKYVLQFNRPVLCSEWMARTKGSDYYNILPLFKKNKIGSYSYGLVNGKQQCHLPWNQIVDGKKIPHTEEPPVWFHDLFHKDGTPWNPDEIRFIKSMTADKNVTAPTEGRESAGKEPVIGKKWSEEKANEWYASQEWPVGCVFVPSFAGTPVERWGAECYDPQIVDKELALAESLGFNVVRFSLCDIVWQNDPEGFMDRLENTISLADKHGLKTLVTFHTNGGTIKNPYLGEQPQPVPGVHNSVWMSSPGKDVVNNPERWPVIEKYQKAIMTKYKDDSRIYAWCLYNEPENTKGFNTLPFLREVFKWAREVNPSQPVTSPLWTCPGNSTSNLPIAAFICENSDIISFHCYQNYPELMRFFKFVQQFNRPVLCTEWMARTKGSDYFSVLPLLKKNKMGSFSYGLVNGKQQCHLPWNKVVDGQKVPFTEEPEIWFHDLFRQDGTPWSREEVDFIKSMTADKNLNR